MCRPVSPRGYLGPPPSLRLQYQIPAVSISTFLRALPSQFL
jgi:hypothetical protein